MKVIKNLVNEIQWWNAREKFQTINGDNFNFFTFNYIFWIICFISKEPIMSIITKLCRKNRTHLRLCTERIRKGNSLTKNKEIFSQIMFCVKADIQNGQKCHLSLVLLRIRLFAELKNFTGCVLSEYVSKSCQIVN